MSACSSDDDLNVTQSLTSETPRIAKMWISDIFEDIASGRDISYADEPLSPILKANNTSIDFSKVDISKIPRELITNNIDYIQDIKTRVKLPTALEDILTSQKVEDKKKLFEQSESLKPVIAAPQVSDNSADNEEDELCCKLKEVFKTLNFRADGKIIVDLVSFTEGLRLMGMKTEEKEISLAFADFDEDNATEVNIQKIISDIQIERTCNIRTLKNQLKEALGMMTNTEREFELPLKDLMGEKSMNIVELKRQRSKDQQVFRGLEAKNRMLEKQVSTLKESLTIAMTQYKSDLMTKSYECDSLRKELRESEGMRKILKNQLNQEVKRSQVLSDRSIKFEENKTQTLLDDQHLREKLDKATARANKYKTKYENLKKELLEMKAGAERKQNYDANSEIQTLRFQLHLMEERKKNQSVSDTKPKKKNKIKESSGKASFEVALADKKPRQASKGKSINRGKQEDIKNSSKQFSKRQKTSIGKSGRKECTTLWKFVTSDFSRHNIRLIHEQASNEVDAQARCRRVVEVDGNEHYNKKSNCRSLLFNISSDKVCINIIWDNSCWQYKLTIGGKLFRNECINVKQK